MVLEAKKSKIKVPASDEGPLIHHHRWKAEEQEVGKRGPEVAFLYEGRAIMA